MVVHGTGRGACGIVASVPVTARGTTGRFRQQSPSGRENGQYGDWGRGLRAPAAGGVPQAVRAPRGYARGGPGGPCLPGMTTTKDPIVAEELTVATAGVPGEPAGPPGRAEELRIHRPARAWPHPPQPAPIELAAPPSEPDGGGGMWTALLPVLGSLSMVAFAFLVHSLIYLIVLGVDGAGHGRRRARHQPRPAPGPVTPVGAGPGAVPGARGVGPGPGGRRGRGPAGRAEACFPAPEALRGVAESGDGNVGTPARRRGLRRGAPWPGRGPGVPAGRAGPGRGPARRGRSGAGRCRRAADRGDGGAPRRAGGDSAGTPRQRRRGGPARGRQGAGRRLAGGAGGLPRPGRAADHGPGAAGGGPGLGLAEVAAAHPRSRGRRGPGPGPPGGDLGRGRLRRRGGIAGPAPPRAAAAADRGVPVRRQRWAPDGETEHVVVVVDGYRPGEGPPALEALLGPAAVGERHGRGAGAGPRDDSRGLRCPGRLGRTRRPSGTSSRARAAGWRRAWSPTGWTRRRRPSWPGPWPRWPCARARRVPTSPTRYGWSSCSAPTRPASWTCGPPG